MIAWMHQLDSGVSFLSNFLLLERVQVTVGS